MRSLPGQMAEKGAIAPKRGLAPWRNPAWHDEKRLLPRCLSPFSAPGGSRIREQALSLGTVFADQMIIEATEPGPFCL